MQKVVSAHEPFLTQLREAVQVSPVRGWQRRTRAWVRTGEKIPTISGFRFRKGGVRRPDVSVDCGNSDPTSKNAIDPRVLFEVLSPPTKAFDRVAKHKECKTGFAEHRNRKSGSDRVRVPERPELAASDLHVRCRNWTARVHGRIVAVGRRSL